MCVLLTCITCNATGICDRIGQPEQDVAIASDVILGLLLSSFKGAPIIVKATRDHKQFDYLLSQVVLQQARMQGLPCVLTRAHLDGRRFGSCFKQSTHSRFAFGMC
jgi:hypothetical protein|tara:strand:- start:428 stop:745 length:318 start_codon:yes stop_codon:yes gene_type:complete